MFKRKIESELYKYYEAKDNPKILIVYGARQIGKSYFIRETQDKNWNIVTTFKDMYNNELIWIKQDFHC